MRDPGNEVGCMFNIETTFASEISEGLLIFRWAHGGKKTGHTINAKPP